MFRGYLEKFVDGAECPEHSSKVIDSVELVELHLWQTFQIDHQHRILFKPAKGIEHTQSPFEPSLHSLHQAFQRPKTIGDSTQNYS